MKYQIFSPVGQKTKNLLYFFGHGVYMIFFFKKEPETIKELKFN